MNRRNALKSTGPRTEAGKEQSRRNAARHGLTAETVIASLEDLEDYKAFEATIIADYDPETAVERELLLRLASLLWRSRRAILIESGLFAIQAEIVRDRRRRRNARTLEPTPEHRFPRLTYFSISIDSTRLSARANVSAVSSSNGFAALHHQCKLPGVVGWLGSA